jgi:hypothetical protein
MIAAPTTSPPDEMMLLKSGAGQQAADWEFWTNGVDQLVRCPPGRDRLRYAVGVELT